jgi:hypothetical protein
VGDDRAEEVSLPEQLGQVPVAGGAVADDQEEPGDRDLLLGDLLEVVAVELGDARRHGDDGG